ncbi:hypothetical protein [Nocardia sp. NPDC052112]|uniref:hypothetical protein n=1 Tax=Nocardia sp. NPDC052112 TaxID=3155646 RepID=UPI0034173510
MAVEPAVSGQPGAVIRCAEAWFAEGDELVVESECPPSYRAVLVSAIGTLSLRWRSGERQQWAQTPLRADRARLDGLRVTTICWISPNSATGPLTMTDRRGNPVDD